MQIEPGVIKLQLDTVHDCPMLETILEDYVGMLQSGKLNDDDCRIAFAESIIVELRLAWKGIQPYDKRNS